MAVASAVLAITLATGYLSCRFSCRYDSVTNAAEKLHSAQAIVVRDPSAWNPERYDGWCFEGNVRGSDVCFDGKTFHVRVDHDLLGMGGWFLSKDRDSDDWPGWPKGRSISDVAGTERNLRLQRGGGSTSWTTD
jgi:hypothetical protein